MAANFMRPTPQAGCYAQVRRAHDVRVPVRVLRDHRGDNKKSRHQIAPYTSNSGGSYFSPGTRESLETEEVGVS